MDPLPGALSQAPVAGASFVVIPEAIPLDPPVARLEATRGADTPFNS